MDKSTLRAARLLLNEDVNPTRESWLLAFGVARRALIVLEKLLPGECVNCRGTGFKYKLPCPTCHGSGKVWDEDLIAAVRYCVPDEYPNGPPEAVLEEIVKRLTDKSVGNG
jgi:hypothetical protein